MRAADVRAAFGNLSDAALAGLAGADPGQIARIEESILTACYTAHAPDLLARDAACFRWLVARNPAAVAAIAYAVPAARRRSDPVEAVVVAMSAGAPVAWAGTVVGP